MHKLTEWEYECELNLRAGDQKNQKGIAYNVEAWNGTGAREQVYECLWVTVITSSWGHLAESHMSQKDSVTSNLAMLMAVAVVISLFFEVSEKFTWFVLWDKLFY